MPEGEIDGPLQKRCQGERSEGAAGAGEIKLTQGSDPGTRGRSSLAEVRRTRMWGRVVVSGEQRARMELSKGRSERKSGEGRPFGAELRAAESGRRPCSADSCSKRLDTVRPRDRERLRTGMCSVPADSCSDSAKVEQPEEGARHSQESPAAQVNWSPWQRNADARCSLSVMQR